MRGRNANQTLRPSFLFTLSLLFNGWSFVVLLHTLSFFRSCCFPFAISVDSALYGRSFLCCFLVGQSIAIGPISRIDRLSEGNDQGKTGTRWVMVLAVGSTTDVAQTRYVCTGAVCVLLCSSSLARRLLSDSHCPSCLPVTSSILHPASRCNAHPVSPRGQTKIYHSERARRGPGVGSARIVTHTDAHLARMAQGHPHHLDRARHHDWSKAMCFP